MPVKLDNTEEMIKQRFLKAVRFIIADYDKYGIKNQSEFVAAIDWRDSNYSRAVNHEDYCIPARYLNKIVLRFGLNADWLLTGRGEMLFYNNVVVSNDKVAFLPENSTIIKVGAQTKTANKNGKSAIKQPY